jgi:hypothetical protein
VTDFLFKSRCLEIPSDNRIGHEPRCVDCDAQNLRVDAFWDINVRSGGRISELYFICPDWFEYNSVSEGEIFFRTSC